MPSIRQRFHLSPCSDFRSHFCVLSAISKDGHTFYQEPGVRYTNPRQTTDPTYFQISEMKWAHYAHDFERMVIVGAISDDGGMSFEPIEGDYIFRTGSPVFARPVSGGFRMWFRDPDSPPGIGSRGDPRVGRISAFSTDAIHWEREQEVQLEGSPNIFTLPDGRMRRYYLARSDQP